MATMYRMPVTHMAIPPEKFALVNFTRRLFLKQRNIISEIIFLTATIDRELQEMDLTQTPARPHKSAVEMISIRPLVLFLSGDPVHITIIQLSIVFRADYIVDCARLQYKKLCKNNELY